MNVGNIIVPSGSELYFVSDTHFSHSRLVKSDPNHFECVRNYDTVEEMNADIIAKWNEYVKPDDYVVFCGDFFMACPVAETLSRFYDWKQRLNGNIIFVKGNHDKIIASKTISYQFYDYVIVKKADNEQIYVCQHRPFAEMNLPLNSIPSVRDAVLVHGHLHGDYKTMTNDFGSLGMLTENNACWEAWYRPVRCDEFVKAG